MWAPPQMTNSIVPRDFLRIASKVLPLFLNPSEYKTTDYLIKHLKSILDEYITKNNLDYIELNYIVGTSLVDGYGRILIQTQTNTF